MATLTSLSIASLVMRDDKLATASIEDTVVPESRRRSNLYGVSSFKHLPRVRLEPPDARVRRDVAAVVLAAADTGGVFSSSSLQQPLVDTLRGHKHHEDLGQRPPMDQIQRLQDLVTTVPKDLGDRDEPDDANRGRKSVTKRVWRVGYANNAHSTSHGPLDGLFEPFDAVRDALQQPLARSQSAAIAYPTPQQSSAEIAADMEPFDEDAARDDMGRRTSIQRNDASACDNDKHWCPASFATIHEAYKPTTTTTPSRSSGSLARDTAKSQGFLIRRVPSDRQDALPPRARKAPLATDDRCVQQKQSLLAKAAASYARLRQRVDRVKDPTVRYALPVEDPSKQRAYRLGLDPVPSSVVETPARNDSDSSHTTATGRPCARERLRFRPRSAAGVHVPFRSLSSLSSSSLSSPHSLEPFTSVSKVAGAKRRPRSASVCYLGSSTVYCTDAPASSSGPSDTLNSDFDSVLDRERDKRRCTQSQTLSLLATYVQTDTCLPQSACFLSTHRLALSVVVNQERHVPQPPAASGLCAAPT